MRGPEILARNLSAAGVKDRHGNFWQYHSRSDRHSKIACWGLAFDLIGRCSLLRRHIAELRVGFGINHRMPDYKDQRTKKLDLVICTPARSELKSRQTFSALTQAWQLRLSAEEQLELAAHPQLVRSPVGSVLIALESKACMTAHQRALPRLYDELNSSQLTVHGANDDAIAAGLVIINTAARFLSTDLNKANFPAQAEWSSHRQPKDTLITVQKVRTIPRRTRAGVEGFDALGIVFVECQNDGTEVKVSQSHPALTDSDLYSYESTIERISSLYQSRFRHLG